MSGNLIKDFDKMLDKEAKEIMDKILDLYYKNVKVNVSFDKLVASLIKKELLYYIPELELRIYKYIPNDLTTDGDDVYALVDCYNDAKRHLTQYIEWCARNGEKNHKKVAEMMADEIIKDLNENVTKGLAELVSSYMPKYFKVHHDSVDSRAIIMLLENEFWKKGYEVVSILPFKLKRITNKK